MHRNFSIPYFRLRLLLYEYVLVSKEVFIWVYIEFLVFISINLQATKKVQVVIGYTIMYIAVNGKTAQKNGSIATLNDNQSEGQFYYFF